MSFSNLNQRMRRDNQLYSVLLELTYRCNLDCFFCYNDVSLAGQPLSLEQYQSLLDELASMGVMTVALSGGEPLSHPHFYEIGAAARQRNFMVRIKTNGHALGAEQAHRVLDEIDPFLVETSLHGATAQTHDRQTRVPGSFERLVKNIEVWRNVGLPVKINSTLTRWNEHEVEGLFAIADRLGCALQVDPEVTPRDDGDTEPLEVAPSVEGVRRLYRLYADRAQRAGSGNLGEVTVGRQDSELMRAPSPTEAHSERRKPSERQKHCGAGSIGIAVDPYGNVYPCVQWRRSIGNLHEQSLRDVWTNRGALGEIRQATEEVAAMLAERGEKGAAMAFCPGLAHTRSGDPLKIYEGALVRAEAVEAAYSRRSAASADSPPDDDVDNGALDQQQSSQRLPVLA